MANLYSELEHNQFKHHILARWITNNKNKFNILFPINKTFLKNYDKREKQALDSYICTFLCFFNQHVHWRILWIIQEKSMHVYLIETIYRSVENRRNDLFFILEAHISEENEQIIKFCKCRFWSLMQSNNDKSDPWDNNLLSPRDVIPSRRGWLKGFHICWSRKLRSVRGQAWSTYHTSWRRIVKRSLRLILK